MPKLIHSCLLPIGYKAATTQGHACMLAPPRLSTLRPCSESELSVTPWPRFVRSHHSPVFDPFRRFLPAQSQSCCREERAECSWAEQSIITARIQETGKHSTFSPFFNVAFHHVLVYKSLTRRSSYIPCGHIWKPLVSEELGISAQSRGDPLNCFLRQEL